MPVVQSEIHHSSIEVQQSKSWKDPAGAAADIYPEVQLQKIFNLIPNYILAKNFQIISIIQLFHVPLYSRIHSFGKCCGRYMIWKMALKAALCDMHDSKSGRRNEGMN